MVLLLISLNNYAYADTTQDMMNKTLQAWAKQTGIDKEAEQSGNYLYSKIPNEVKKPLEIIAIMVDTVNKQSIQIELINKKF